MQLVRQGEREKGSAVHAVREAKGQQGKGQWGVHAWVCVQGCADVYVYVYGSVCIRECVRG